MKLVFDNKTDTAYLYLRAATTDEICRSIRCEDAPIVFEIDRHSKVVRVTVFEAGKYLPAKTLATSEGYADARIRGGRRHARGTKPRLEDSLRGEEESRNAPSDGWNRWIFHTTLDGCYKLAYIYLRPSEPGMSACQYSFEELPIILDFDSDGRLIGIEVLAAKRLLPDEVIRRAQRR